MTAIFRATCVLIAIAATARLSLVAQQPTFRSGVELVTVDVTVVDDTGNPIEGLQAGSFDVRVDGAPRRVVSADYVRYRPTSGPAAIQAGDFSSNENIDAGRLILIAVDRAHIRRVEGLAALTNRRKLVTESSCGVSDGPRLPRPCATGNIGNKTDRLHR